MSQKPLLTIICVLFGLIAGYKPSNCSGDEVNRLEYEIKSACVLNFLKFINLPAKRNAIESQMVDIALVGKSPAVKIIRETLHERMSDKKKIMVNDYQDLERLLESNRIYDIVYLVAPGPENITQAVLSLDKASKLTISEIPDFCQKSGMINFRLDNGKVRFDINPAAARQANIRISSQLLKLANIVEIPEANKVTPKNKQEEKINVLEKPVI